MAILVRFVYQRLREPTLTEITANADSCKLRRTHAHTHTRRKTVREKGRKGRKEGGRTVPSIKLKHKTLV